MIDLSFFNHTGYESLEPFLGSILQFAVGISVLLAVISIIISGFKFMLAMGDEDKIKEAQKSLTFSILGLVLVFIAPTVIEFVLDKIVNV